MKTGVGEPVFHHASHDPPPDPVGRRGVWGEMLRAAARLGVGPEGFWRLSLLEWRMLTERPEGAAPMGREEFARMAETWPD